MTSRENDLLLHFVAPFSRYLPWIYCTSYKLFFLQCMDYFLHPFGIIFSYCLWIIFGYPPRIIFGYCQLNFWFHDALRDLDLYVYQRANTGGICANQISSRDVPLSYKQREICWLGRGVPFNFRCNTSIAWRKCYGLHRRWQRERQK